MNSLLFKIGVGAIALTALFLTLTCGTSPGTANQNLSQSPSQNANQDPRIAELRARCQDSTSNTNTKAEAVNSAIRNKLAETGSDPLRRQISDNRLGYTFAAYGTDQIEIVISGRFHGTMLNLAGQAGEETTMEGFLDVLDDFTKRGCLGRVRFVPAAGASAPFEWIGCDAGTVYCSNGQCLPPGCAGLVNSGTSTPVNATPNSN